MKSLSLTAYPRALTKRNGAKKVRNSGRVPAVIYGRQNAPQNLEIGTKALENMIHQSPSQNILLDLSIEGDGNSRRLALVQEVQHHPLNGKVLHVDLREVAESEKVEITVPIETTGEAVGVKTGGGVLEHVLFRLRVRALPKDLPEVLEVDVTSLEIGQSFHIGDIKPPEGVELIGDKKVVILSVAAPLTEAQETAAETAATAGPLEPEMIKEKKEEGAAEDKAGSKPEKADSEKGKADKKK
jgi:large subunit ribosomal protein L25